MVMRYSENKINDLIDLLKNDDVISVPTDTVYGLCARMDSWQAQENLRTIKHRPKTKSFPIMCADLNQIKEICKVNEMEEKIICHFMPGPLTIVLKKQNHIADYVNGGMETIAIRMATSPILKRMIQGLGVAVFMTSANQSGEFPCKTLEEVEQSCKGIGAMLEGNTEFGVASTIVQCIDSEIHILRKGPISLEELLKVISCSS